MSKISVQQRKYFTDRIQTAINNKISILKHKNASRVTKMGNKQFDNYLNEIDNSNWRMFNTVTDYIDHYNSKVEHDNGFSMFGSGNQTKLRAFKMLSN